MSTPGYSSVRSAQCTHRRRKSVISAHLSNWLVPFGVRSWGVRRQIGAGGPALRTTLFRSASDACFMQMCMQCMRSSTLRQLQQLRPLALASRTLVRLSHVKRFQLLPAMRAFLCFPHYANSAQGFICIVMLPPRPALPILSILLSAFCMRFSPFLSRLFALHSLCVRLRSVIKFYGCAFQANCDLSVARLKRLKFLCRVQIAAQFIDDTTSTAHAAYRVCFALKAVRKMESTSKLHTHWWRWANNPCASTSAAGSWDCTCWSCPLYCQMRAAHFELPTLCNAHV